MTICPYCGARSRASGRCDACRGQFDPLSRQATQNAMGPWFLRDEASPYRPGCSYETIVQLVQRGKIQPDTVMRGPTTLQFWTLARWCPGVAHLLGECHSCHAHAEAGQDSCAACGASFRVDIDRQSLGLGDVRYVPGRGAPPATPAAPRVRAQAESAQPSRLLASPAADTEADARTGRLARELAVARRWRTAWACACCLLAAGWLFVLIAPALDLDAGPVGRWIHGSEAQRGRVSPPDLSDSRIPDVDLATPGQSGQTGPIGGAAQEPETPAVTTGGAAPESQDPASPAASPGDPPTSAPQVQAPPAGDSELARLRKLR